MRHEIPDWMVVLIKLLPFLVFGAVLIIIWVRYKRGYRPKKLSLKGMAQSLLLWIVVALVLVAVLNLMQGARH